MEDKTCIDFQPAVGRDKVPLHQCWTACRANPFQQTGIDTMEKTTNMCLFYTFFLVLTSTEPLIFNIAFILISVYEQAHYINFIYTELFKRLKKSFTKDRFFQKKPKKCMHEYKKNNQALKSISVMSVSPVRWSLKMLWETINLKNADSQCVETSCSFVSFLICFIPLYRCETVAPDTNLITFLRE